MTEEEARAIACATLNCAVRPLTIISALSKPYGWVVGYQATAFVETGDPRQRIVGNAPLLVLHDGRVIHPSPPRFGATIASLDAAFAEHGDIEPTFNVWRRTPIREMLARFVRWSGRVFEERGICANGGIISGRFRMPSSSGCSAASGPGVRLSRRAGRTRPNS